MSYIQVTIFTHTHKKRGQKFIIGEITILLYFRFPKTMGPWPVKIDTYFIYKSVYANKRIIKLVNYLVEGMFSNLMGFETYLYIISRNFN